MTVPVLPSFSDADPHQCHADPDTACHFHVAADPTFHLDVDPNPSFQINAQPLKIAQIC